MWKRDEAVRPASGPPAAAPQPPQTQTAPTQAPRPEASHSMERDNVNIGKSVVIKGELNGSEDLTIEGQVEGTIQLKEHVLTIGPNGKIKAQVFAKSVIVLGEVTGNVTATSSRRASRLPRVRTSAAASTCSARPRRPPRPRPRRPPSRRSPRLPPHRSPRRRNASAHSKRTSAKWEIRSTPTRVSRLVLATCRSSYF
jgi:bactofilin